MLKTYMLILAISSFFYGNAQQLERTLKQDDPRFTIKYKYGWNNISEYETCNFYIHNNSNEVLNFVVDVTIFWTCERSFKFKLGYNNVVHIKPGGDFTAENDDWVHSVETKKYKKECFIDAGNGRLTTIANLSFSITKESN